MKQATLPEAIYLEVDGLDYSERDNAAAMVATVKEPFNVIGVI